MIILVKKKGLCIGMARLPFQKGDFPDKKSWVFRLELKSQYSFCQHIKVSDMNTLVDSL